MRINLGNTPLFRGMTVPDIEEMLCCLRAAERTYKKGAVILPEGMPTEQLGVVLSGRVIIEMGDVWGNNSVLSSVGAGGIFAEAYACAPGEPLMVNVTAAEDTEVLLLHIGQVLEPCAKVCPRHLRLLRNLLTLSAGKNLQLSRRVCYDSPSEEEPRVSLEDQFAKGGNSDPQEGTKKKQRQDDKNQSARRSRDKNNPAPSRGDQNTKSR